MVFIDSSYLTEFLMISPDKSHVLPRNNPARFVFFFPLKDPSIRAYKRPPSKQNSASASYPISSAIIIISSNNIIDIISWTEIKDQLTSWELHH